MKKIILLALVFTVSIATNAQRTKLKEGSLMFLKGETHLNVVFDYSVLQIDKQSEKNFIEGQVLENGETWKEEWETAKKQNFYGKFINSFNKKMIGTIDLRGGKFSAANYQAVVRIVNLDDDYDMDAEVIFTSLKSDSVMAIVKLYGAAGTFGSMTNLIGDAMQKAGEKLSKLIIETLFPPRKGDDNYYRPL